MPAPAPVQVCEAAGWGLGDTGPQSLTALSVPSGSAAPTLPTHPSTFTHVSQPASQSWRLWGGAGMGLWALFPGRGWRTGGGPPLRSLGVLRGYGFHEGLVPAAWALLTLVAP